MNFIARFAFVGALLVGSLALVPASAQNVTVVVNGQVMSFDQAPVVVNNRVFVPMRAIFERLGSTVSYANGNINAQGNGRSVHLAIGSMNASVNGNPLTMDVAPFLVNGRTEVPLRFVAQALGANVNWNGNTSTVYIATSGNTNTSTPQPYATQTPSYQSFYLNNEHPANGGMVKTTHPKIHATFSEPVDLNSLHVSVDENDVTSLVYTNAGGFDVTPGFALNPGNHNVNVSGTTSNGSSFNTGWSFYTSNTASGTAQNYIVNVTPAPNTRTGSSFTLSGRTLPNSQIHIVATGTSTIGGLFQIGTGTFQSDVTADANGYFTAPISLNVLGGGQIRVILTSVSPNGASVENQVVYGV